MEPLPEEQAVHADCDVAKSLYIVYIYIYIYIYLESIDTFVLLWTLRFFKLAWLAF